VSDELQEEVKVPEAQEAPPAAPEQAAEPEQAEIEAVRNEVQALKAERDDLKDQLLRKAADSNNYRKRMMKEKEDARLFANSSLLEDLVQVLDDFERAIRSSEGAKDYDSFHSGIVMIEGQFASMLERKYNLKRFESHGKPFQPEFHEAIAMDQAGESPDMVVIEEYQKGYQLHDRVLRTAKVKVGPTTNSETKEGEITMEKSSNRPGHHETRAWP